MDEVDLKDLLRQIPTQGKPFMQQIFDEVRAEREYQDKRWGHNADDTVNSPNDFVAYIAHYATRWLAGSLPPKYSTSVLNTYRKQMIKVAALAVAAIESLDRQRVANGKAFFEG